jgi:flagellar biosynthesis protein FlhA
MHRLAAAAVSWTMAAASGINVGIFGIKSRKEAAETPSSAEISAKPETNSVSASNKTSNALLPKALKLEFGCGLTPMVDSTQDGNFLERIRFIRQQTVQNMGIELPELNIHCNQQLKPYEYNLLIQGVRVGGSELIGQYLAMDSGDVTTSISGISTKEPIFELPAVWIEKEAHEAALINGYSVVDSTTVIATHISELIKRHSHELSSYQKSV